MIGGKSCFFKDKRYLRTADMKPDVFPRLVFVSLIKCARVFRDQKDLVRMRFMHLVIDAENTFPCDYEVKDDPVFDQMLIRIERFAFIPAQFIQIEIIRILIIDEFAKIASPKFLRHIILLSDTGILYTASPYMFNFE